MGDVGVLCKRPVRFGNSVGFIVDRKVLRLDLDAVYVLKIERVGSVGGKRS